MTHSQDSLALSPSPAEPLPAVPEADEEFIEDGRAALSPAQEVEQKLLRVLRAGPAMVSQLQAIYRPRPS